MLDSGSFLDQPQAKSSDFPASIVNNAQHTTFTSFFRTAFKFGRRVHFALRWNAGVLLHRKNKCGPF